MQLPLLIRASLWALGRYVWAVLGVLIQDVFKWIYRNPVQAHFVMHVRTGAAAGIANQGNGFPALNFFAAFF